MLIWLFFVKSEYLLCCSVDAVFTWTPLWLRIMDVCIVIWGVFLNWIVLRQYHFVWIYSLTPPTLTHTSLSSHTSSDLLYPEMPVKSGDEVWGNSSKISRKDTAGKQPASTKETIAAPLPLTSRFSELLCTCTSDVLAVTASAKRCDAHEGVTLATLQMSL